MSSAAAALPKGAAGSLLAALELILTGGDSSSAELKAGTVWLWPAGVEAAQFILDAKSLDDLHDRIDEVLEERGPALADGQAEAAKKVGGSAPKDSDAMLARWRADTDPARERLARVIGDGPAKRWAQGWEDLMLLVQVFSAMNRAEGPSSASENAENENTDGAWYESLVYTTHSVKVRRAFWGVFRGLVALLPIQLAYETQKPLEKWIAHALADTFAAGMGGFLKTLGEYKPDDERSALSPAVLAEWDQAALGSGEAVFFPLGDAEKR